MAGRNWRRLMDHVADLARVPSRIAKPISEKFNAEIQLEFAQGSDPYGFPWKPLAPYTIRKKGHDLIMIQTGETQKLTLAQPLGGAGIELVSTKKAGWNMDAHGNRPARPVLPHRKELPERWQAIIEAEWKREFQRVMSK